MAASLLGLVLDSSTAIAAERGRQSVADLIESILRAHGPLDLSLSPVTVAESVHGIFRARTLAVAHSRQLFVEELISLVPVHPFTEQPGGAVGQIALIVRFERASSYFAERQAEAWRQGRSLGPTLP